MELSEVLNRKYADFERSLKGFKNSLGINISELDEIVADAVKNGQIQKFEYNLELLWKLIKKFIYELDGVDAISPKKAIKEFYRNGYIDAGLYEKLIEMIDARNLLSHSYNEKDFEEIAGRMQEYCNAMLRAGNAMKSHIK